MKEFDFQWTHLPSKNIEYNEERVKEFLSLTKLSQDFFQGKLCLDAGCGNGRYTYAMQQLGAKVVSFDISKEAVEKCRKINPEASVSDLMKLEPNPIFDFVLCWGVLHHLENPREGFRRVVSQVKPNGSLFIMVYHKDTQKRYKDGRKNWHKLSYENRLELIQQMINKYGGDIHGWYDAFNPKYNWSFKPKEIKKWFEQEGFKDITLTLEKNINMRGIK